MNNCLLVKSLVFVYWLGLLHGQKFAHLTAVGLLKNSKLVEVTFTLLCLLGQNVAVVSVFTLDFTRSGKSESFFRTGVRLDFWHVFNCLIGYY